MNKTNSQQGFALLEALIAMFITAGVLLGLGVLHIKSVQQSALTTQRTIATIQANDLIDRMWASVCSLDDGTTGLPTDDTIKPIREQWEKRWKVENNEESAFVKGLTADQIALHSRMTGWAGDLKIDDVDPTRRRYEITIKWENKKAKWYEDNPADKESFIYYFSVPKCEV